MRGDFELPDGSTVRVESTQRFVVVVWRPTGIDTGSWKVQTRRQTRETGLAAWRAVMREQAETDVAPHLLDTERAEVIR